MPSGFGADHASAWSHWVLAHGLPELPGPELAAGRSVPVAYWIGPTTAAVLHVRRLPPDDPGGAPLTETDADLFRLEDEVWIPYGGGGGGWTSIAPLARSAIDPRSVALDVAVSGVVGGRGCTALLGEVGIDAATIEVHQAGRVTRRAVATHNGAVVVCAESELPFTVRVLDASGAILHTADEPADGRFTPTTGS